MEESGMAKRRDPRVLRLIVLWLQVDPGEVR